MWPITDPSHAWSCIGYMVLAHILIYTNPHSLVDRVNSASTSLISWWYGNNHFRLGLGWGMKTITVFPDERDNHCATAAFIKVKYHFTSKVTYGASNATQRGTVRRRPGHPSGIYIGDGDIILNNWYWKTITAPSKSMIWLWTSYQIKDLATGIHKSMNVPEYYHPHLL